MTTIATAGHVDHGKSTLVLALTGVDPDRWAEEKERGLTIDLGFAALELPSGRRVSVVDVPGHERFIRNMLAGVGAVDACVFVVAATEGWKPQSEEHLRILELLGIRRGVVALTKRSLVDDELAELAELDVEEHVEGTSLEGAPIVAVDGLDGRGLAELRRRLDLLLDELAVEGTGRRPRLWIDRVFAAKGSGTVVTGTLTGGPLRVDDELEVATRGRTVRVRALQSHHDDVTEASPGVRLAVNLTGVSHDDLARGDVLVRPGQWHRTRRFDAELHVLADLDHEVSRRGAYLAYVGSGEFPVKVRILGPEALGPGTVGRARIHLDRALPLMIGDRFVLREAGRAETVGGGRVLDPDPVRRASQAEPTGDLDDWVAERGYVSVDHLRRVSGREVAPTLGSWVVDPGRLAADQERVRATVEAAGPLGLDVAALDERDRAVLDTLDDVTVAGGRASTAGDFDPLADHPVIALLESAPFQPPEPEGIDRAELRELIRRGTLVDLGGVIFAASAIDLAARRVAELLATKPDGVTVAEVREALGTSRKYAMPLLQRLDETGVTRRRDDLRIAGPRLPALDA